MKLPINRLAVLGKFSSTQVPDFFHPLIQRKAAEKKILRKAGSK